MRRSRRAKIVATVGPACCEPEMLRTLFEAGVDTFRLNFSHGAREDHARVHVAIRALEAEMGRPIGILLDLQGPKIRIGTLRDGSLTVAPGETVRFVQEGAGDRDAIPLPHPEVFLAAAPGHDLLIDDGRLCVRVKTLLRDSLEAEVIVGGKISNHKGVNLPGTILDLSPLTRKHRADLEFGLRLGVDWVALSFVQRPGDLIEARGLIGDRAGLVAKFEKPAALDRIDDIISLSDAVMVARGDLGVEIPHEDVPGRQKELVRACRLAVKPVIVATQMLDSMVSSPTPTRAEASDVATAIYDGADAVMLSAESAVGRYPREAVEMMDRIIRSTERHKMYRSIVDALRPDEEQTPPHAVATAAAGLASAIHAAAIVVYTSGGTTAARIARRRPDVPLLAVTPSSDTARRLCLLWGTHSVFSSDVSDYEEMVSRAVSTAVGERFADSLDHVVIVAGIPFAQAGTTNNIRVIAVP
ncbi:MULTISPECIES: pyruvate kinase [Bradyrhizobium]|uniref:pyruvate kinase n=1 Tax=Bradyrhizobium TaxID=374 RepID=UPI00155ED1EF|nr:MULTISPECIES: pyruvate kinase [Bradyrhizobium]MDD1523014.1 pyruvate kinase [Bradyrhizobium sp. WBAH30]MDD1547093.1 pyruvate kinase [Bradyrhizobium sp. WBAH41]MDD1560669.1 pyruvate kinase [Bradyrhizobium sp. WBAH23]MDD1568138.1 pyruvate kinase [Bradyrhizobium sp. WBAH33]MDD1594087.1 pyruvate kinase [Bradyrhizobium sp. WBAH42]